MSCKHPLSDTVTSQTILRKLFPQTGIGPTGKSDMSIHHDCLMHCVATLNEKSFAIFGKKQSGEQNSFMKPNNRKQECSLL